MSTLALLSCLLVGIARSQPPHNPSQWLTSPDLPGMPIEITDCEYIVTVIKE